MDMNEGRVLHEAVEKRFPLHRSLEPKQWKFWLRFISTTAVPKRNLLWKTDIRLPSITKVGGGRQVLALPTSKYLQVAAPLITDLLNLIMFDYNRRYCHRIIFDFRCCYLLSLRNLEDFLRRHIGCCMRVTTHSKQRDDTIHSHW